MKKKTNEMVSELLKIRLGEYLILKHRPLRESFDLNGKVNGYYIHFSKDNPAAILGRLNMDKRNIVHFKRVDGDELIENLKSHFNS